MNETVVERMFQDHVAQDMIDEAIVTEQYHVFPGTVHTVCCLSLRNGHSVIGGATPAHPEDFDPEIGQRVARADARDKIWMLEGYAMKDRLYKMETERTAQVPPPE